MATNIIPFQYNGNPFRIEIDSKGDLWFDGPDVCKALGLLNPSLAYGRLDEDEKQPLSSLKGRAIQQGVDRIYVSESGLYSLILQSRRPEAKEFKRWITHDVLPSIRKRGSYQVESLNPLQALDRAMKAFHEAILNHEERITDLEKDQKQLQAGAFTPEVTHYTIVGWVSVNRLNILESSFSYYGKLAKQMSKEREYEIKELPDKRWGKVNAYHKDILREVFGAIN